MSRNTGSTSANSTRLCPRVRRRRDRRVIGRAGRRARRRGSPASGSWWSWVRRRTPCARRPRCPCRPAFGDLEAGEADDVVPAAGAVAARGIPDGHGHGDLVVDVVRAVSAGLVAGQAADPVEARDADLGAAAVAVAGRADLALEERLRVRAAAGVLRRILAEPIAVAAELEPAEAAGHVEVAGRQLVRIARVGRDRADRPRAEREGLEERQRDPGREQRAPVPGPPVE